MIGLGNILKTKIDFFICLLIILSAPLFLYKLGDSSLISFDEAWYADISRNIINSGEILKLKFNQDIYNDHPPAGFWLIAISFKLFGISEFTDRLPSALAGIGCLIVLYFLGKELFNRYVGFSSSIALLSSPWFLFRARSGNLDIFLTLFFLLTLFLAFKSSRNKKYLYMFSISFILLMLTKTLVPFTILPVLFLIFLKSKLKISELMKPFLLVLTVFIFWFSVQLQVRDNFVDRYFGIGLPGAKVDSNYLENLKIFKEYLHSGIGKWFWPGVISLGLGPLFLQRRFLVLSIFFVSFSVPFLFSNKGNIWHLIPLHPILVLGFFGFTSELLIRIINLKIFKLKKTYLKNLLIGLLIIGIAIYYGYIQSRANYYQFVDIPKFISDEEILGIESSRYQEELYTDGWYSPAVVFYSQKKVNFFHGGNLNELFNLSKPFLLITKQTRLNEDKISKDSYQILKNDRDRILILKKN